MSDPKIKICGMKHNISEVADLAPDYLGFIFYPESPRDFSGEIPNIPDNIKKVGVFVDSAIDNLVQIVLTYDIDIIQLHGHESPHYCKQLQLALDGEMSSPLELWKVFHIKDSFDFNLLKPYEDLVDAFLFDTKGKDPGGNGYTFNWEVLREYKADTPIILSGGIGLEELPKLKQIFTTDLPLMAVDVNSRFELKPGKKDIVKLKEFIDELSS